MLIDIEQNKINFIDDSNKKFNNKFDYSFIEYRNNAIKVKIICPIHGELWQTPRVHYTSKYGCKHCATSVRIDKLKKIAKNKFISNSNKIHDNYYDYSKFVYLGHQIKSIIICNKHGEFLQTPAKHFCGHGCKKCNVEKRNKKYTFTLNEFINKANIVHNNRYDYSLVEYINSQTKVKIICPIHGIFYQKPNGHLNGNNCENCCNVSKGEAKIENYLISNKINFIRQKQFNDCKYIKLLKFDFYLPDYNLCIEYDGLHHYKAIPRFGGLKNLNNIQIRDSIKNKYCINNNILLKRISYKDYKNINTILQSLIKTL